MACFPKIVDNIDILEVLAQVWAEDVLAGMSAQQKKSVKIPLDKAKEIIHRIYPVLFADAFDLHESNYMDSACFDENTSALRQKMLMSALRQGNANRARGQPQNEPLESLSTFKPFNIRETCWEVWDVRESKYEQYLNLHQSRGMFDNAPQPIAAAAAGQNMLAGSAGIAAPMANVLNMGNQP